MTAPRSPRWMSLVLAAAAAYNLSWAAWAIAFPELSFARSGLQHPDRPLDYPQLWQGLAVLVGVFGLGYALAATNPARHWGIVLIGLISKLAGGLGAATAVLDRKAYPDALAWAAFNDFIWWVPFAMIVRHGFRQPHRDA